MGSREEVDTVERFLAGPVAGQIRLPGRVVVRRTKLSLEEFESADRGTVEFDAPPVCELEVGGVVVATGTIRDEGGERWFVATEEENR